MVVLLVAWEMSYLREEFTSRSSSCLNIMHKCSRYPSLAYQPY